MGESRTPEDTRAHRLRCLADEFERTALAYLHAAVILRAHASKDWPQ